MSVKVLEFKADKGGTLARQDKQYESAKKQWEEVLASSKDIVSSQIVERENEYRFVAVVRMSSSQLKNFTLSPKKKRGRKSKKK